MFDILERPCLARRDVMEGGYDIRRARLPDDIQRHRIIWPEPPPSLPHSQDLSVITNSKTVRPAKSRLLRVSHDVEGISLQLNLDVFIEGDRAHRYRIELRPVGAI